MCIIQSITNRVSILEKNDTKYILSKKLPIDIVDKIVNTKVFDLNEEIFKCFEKMIYLNKKLNKNDNIEDRENLYECHWHLDYLLYKNAKSLHFTMKVWKLYDDYILTSKKNNNLSCGFNKLKIDTYNLKNL